MGILKLTNQPLKFYTGQFYTHARTGMVSSAIYYCAEYNDRERPVVSRWWCHGFTGEYHRQRLQQLRILVVQLGDVITQQHARQ